SGSGLTSNDAINFCRGHSRPDTAKVIAIKQIAIAIFAQCEHQLRRRRASDIDEHGAAATEIGVTIVEIEPISGRPFAASLPSKDRSRLQTNNCFATAPVPSSVERIPDNPELLV